MPLPTLAQWQKKTSSCIRTRTNPLILDIDTLLTAYYSTGKTDIQKQKILILMLYICTEWLVTKSKKNWRRAYVTDLIGKIEIELRTPAMVQAAQDRIGAAGLTMKEDPIEALQPKDRSAKYGLTGTVNFQRLSGHGATGFVSGYSRTAGLTGYAAKLQNIIPGDYVDGLKILAAGNAKHLHKLKMDLAYLSKAERQQLQLSIGDDLLFHQDGNPSAYTSLGDIPDLCVIDTLELVYVSSNKAAGKFHHSSFFSGKPVLFAGELRLRQGVVNYINSLSGHYRPSTQELLDAVTILRDRYGCDLSRIRVEDGSIKPIAKWASADEFLKRQGKPKATANTGGKAVTGATTI